jgi:superoxide dismutase, Cu-Zn family
MPMRSVDSARSLAVRGIPLAILLAASAGGCYMMGMKGERRASAMLFDTSGRQVGVIALTQAGSSVEVSGDLKSLAPGEHGIHFHTVGRCDAAGAFASAGGHFNPAVRKHGLENPEGPHAGDMPNLIADETGAVRYRATTSRVTLASGSASLLDADGSAIVVHATSDDQRTDPAGNSGARVACGLVKER